MWSFKAHPVRSNRVFECTNENTECIWWRSLMQWLFVIWFTFAIIQNYALYVCSLSALAYTHPHARTAKKNVCQHLRTLRYFQCVRMIASCIRISFCLHIWLVLFIHSLSPHILYCVVRLSYHHIPNLSYCCRLFHCINIYFSNVCVRAHMRSRVKGKRCTQAHSKYLLDSWHEQTSYQHPIYIFLMTSSATYAFYKIFLSQNAHRAYIKKLKYECNTPTCLPNTIMRKKNTNEKCLPNE